MRITPLDIKKQPFRKCLWGFDPDQVNSFLEMVSNEFEALIRQNNELASQLKITSERLQEYTKIEKTLNQTLLSAQKTSDEARMNAQKEAELIIKDAQLRAQTHENESRRIVQQLENEIASLRTQRDGFLLRFRALLKTQIELLETLSVDLQEDSGLGRKNREETMSEIAAQPNLTANGTG